MSTIYLSHTANPLLQDYLKSKGHKLYLVKSTPFVYPEVSSHADIYMCKLGAEPLSPIHYISNFNELGFKYPNNIKYNGVCMGNYFIHALKHTSPSLIDKINSLNLKLINTAQGYTKCNMVILNDTSAITSDKGIYNNIINFFEINKDLTPLNILLINPGHVILKGFPYGFLGGASGRVGDEIIFNGNLEAHQDFNIIVNFIKEQNLSLKYFKDYPLEDIGSIIEHKQTVLDNNLPI